MKYLLSLLLLAPAAFAQSNPYTTTAPMSTENPISQGGVWRNGGTNGTSWGNMQADSNGIHGASVQTGCSNPPPNVNCNDSTANLTGVWAANQTACGTVYFGAINRSGPVDEIELKLNQTITPGNITGYEFTYSIFNNGNQYAGVVRWNGPLGSFTSIGGVPSPVPILADGDIICVNHSGGQLKMTRQPNGSSTVTTLMSVADTSAGGAVYNGGAPGVGVFNSGTLADNLLYGWKSWTGSAATSGIIAASCNHADVNAVINGPTHKAINGDVITIPPGNCTWTSGITMPTGIGFTLQGTGTRNDSTSTQGASTSCSQTSVTLNTNAAAAFIATPAVTSPPFQLLCMAIPYGGAYGSTAGGAIGFSILGTCNTTTCSKIRISNLSFTGWSDHLNANISYGINAVGDVFGVVDHNNIIGDTIHATNGIYLDFIELNNASFLNPNAFYGDSSWALSENYGSDQFLFFENNVFTYAGCCENEGNAGGINHEGGNRTVLRFNTFNLHDQFNPAMGWHGTESNGRPRGGRAWEFYDNTLNYPATCIPSGNCTAYIGVRSGTGLTWGQTINSATTHAGGISAVTNRTAGTAGGWPACDGTATQDPNDSAGVQFTGTIQSVVLNSGGLSRTVTVNAGGTGTVTPWTTNQWSPPGAPYSMHDVTISTAKALAVGTEIQSNTANTLIVSNAGGPTNFTPVVGDTIQITRAFSCIDQGFGRGAGVLVGGTPIPHGPMNEVLSPSYMFFNTFTNLNPGEPYVGSNTLRVIRNREWYAEGVTQGAQTSATSPFDGTTTTICAGTTVACGIGHGTLARRPTTCTTGTFYFATDQGSWNTSGSGNGLGYICTATNVWTLSYTPFCYPHYLTNGGVSPCSGAGTPAISLNPGSLSFGNVLVGSTSAVQQVTLQNTGTGTLTLTSITLAGTDPGDYLQQNTCVNSVAAGGSCTISVQFKPTTTGSRPATVSVVDNAAGSPHTVTLSGTGTSATASFSPSPTSLTFSSQTVGTSSSPQTITITNSGSAALLITSIVSSGTNAGDFVPTPTGCSSVAPSGGTCTVSVVFTPAATGTRSSAIVFTDNASGSPQSVPVSGAGAGGVAAIGFNPTSLSFPNTAVSVTSAALNTTVTNTGGASLTLSSITLTGTNASDFAISSTTCGGSLAIGAGCVVCVTFTPSAVGARTANITFTDNAAVSPQNVPLSGTATQSGTSFSPTSISFGSQTVNTTSAVSSTTLTNTGTATIVILSVTLTGVNSSDFAISSNTCISGLAPSATCTVGVTFTPSAVGSRAANISFSDSAPNSPQTVPLTGTGTSSASVSFSPTSLAFGQWPVGTSSGALPVVMTNTGGSNITGIAITITGANSFEYSQTNNCPSTLAPAATCTINAVFSPPIPGGTTAALSIADSVAGSPQTIPMTGQGTQGVLTITPAGIAFGNQAVGTTSGSLVTTLQNTGTATINFTLNPAITGANPSYFTIASNTCGTTLAVSATCAIGVTFTPGTTGSFTAQITFTDTAANSPQNQPLSGTGTGTAGITFNPTSITFPNTAVSTASAPLSTVLTNPGTLALTISGITITGTNAGDFAQTNNCGGSVAAGGNCTINVTFTPASTGSRSASVSVSDSASGSPHTVALAGMGFTPAPIVSLSTATVTFGNQTVGTQSNPLTATLTNTGTSSLTISSTSITGINSADYSSTTTCGGTLAVNATCSYSFKFTPSGPGTRTATFNLSTNAATSPDHIALSGTGVASPGGVLAPQVFGDD